MNRKNVTRNALFTSIISLLLCVSMLVGTTFAWFTDEVVTGMNTIAAGNLDIELLANGTKVDSATKLFDDVTLWEPGVVVYENLQVANVGTLALKYQMSLNFGNENDLNGHKLSEVLKIAVVDKIADGADRQAVLAAAKSAENVGTLANFCLAGSLLPGAVATEQAIVIFWEPNANEIDNLYNANNGQTTSDGEALHIEFGVNLQATQLMYEEDSFGPEYDGAASWVTLVDTDWYFENPDADEFTIYSAEELAGLAALVNGTAVAPVTTFAATEPATVQDSFTDKIVKLGGNIDLAGHAWTSIGNWDNVFQGTFDGQGYTISNLYINAPEGEGVGLFGVVEKATIKNFTINNAKIKGYSMVAAVAGAAYPATISNCHVTGEINLVAEWAYVAGIAGYCYYGTQVDGCSVIAERTGLIKSETRNAVGGITAWLLEGNHKVLKCQVKNLDLVGWTNVGGITGFVHYSNTIDGCSVENVNLVKTRVDGNPGIGLIAGGYSYSANNAITLTNNSVNDVTMSGTHIAYEKESALYGSEYGGATTANFVLENNTVGAVEDKLVVISPIKNADALKAALTNGGANYILTADIELDVAETGFTVEKGKSVKIDLNGHDIIAAGTTDENAQLFSVSGNLEIVGEGTISLTSSDYAWNNSYRYTAINIRETGVVTLGKGVKVVCEAHEEGVNGMSYAVDIYTTGTLNVEGASLHSNYIAVRCFYGASVVNVNSGSITSSKNNWGIWLQSASGAQITIADGIEYETDSYGIYIFK